MLTAGVAILGAFLLYDPGFGNHAMRGEVAQLWRSHGLRYAALAAIVVALEHGTPSLPVPLARCLLLGVALGLPLSSLPRLVAYRFLQHQLRLGSLHEVVVIVGDGHRAAQLMTAMQRTRSDRLRIAGTFCDVIAAASRPGAQDTAPLEELWHLARTQRIDSIVLALPAADSARIAALIRHLAALQVPIYLAPSHLDGELTPERLGYAADTIPVRLLADRPIRRWGAVVKIGEDLILGSLITLLLLPVLLCIAIAIRLSGPGPVIFRQRRHALDNREFDIYKFRTMHWQPAGETASLQQTRRDDQRITRVGRFLRSTSLDELPQLFNVLQGDMSLVGPRPHAVNMRTEDLLGNQITDLYLHRHRVKPGMTGWSQVNGARGATDTTEQLQRRVSLDLHYIENWSLLLDLRILMLTSKEVIRRTNAY
jgi:Undecaprenyl-phosphate glucose phosphotransferase